MFSDSAQIFIKLESFTNVVSFMNEETDSFNFNPYDHIITDEEDQKVNEIIKKHVFQELTVEDKRILWKNRYHLSQRPSAIPKLLQCLDYRNREMVKEIDKVVSICKPISCKQALAFLTGQCLHDSIRKYAVNCLKKASLIEIKDYVIQLVQALKYEMFHDSYLAEFLLKIAINNPLTIGHSIFWCFKSEMYNPIIQQRFGLYLEVFLSKIGDLRKVFENEIWILERLLKAADIPHDNNLHSKEDKLTAFRKALQDINQTYPEEIISLPLNFKMRVKKLRVEKCKFMISKKKPLWLVFENEDPSGEDIYVIFKKGDDLRQDILTLQLFKVMHNLWFEGGHRTKMTLYNVISTGYFSGMLEIVTNSETLATIHKNYGMTAAFSWKPLKLWFEKNSYLSEAECVKNFLYSCAPYCLATLVLGIGDRHNDNIMVKKNGELFHIDFGHFLGHFKYKFGIKRERAPFVFTSEFLNVLGGDKSENFKQFKELSHDCFQILRRNSEVLVTLLKIMLCTGIPELTNHSIKFMHESLALNLDSSSSQVFLDNKFEDALNSFATKLNFAIHIIAN